AGAAAPAAGGGGPRTERDRGGPEGAARGRPRGGGRGDEAGGAGGTAPPWGGRFVKEADDGALESWPGSSAGRPRRAVLRRDSGGKGRAAPGADATGSVAQGDLRREVRDAPAAVQRPRGCRQVRSVLRPWSPADHRARRPQGPAARPLGVCRAV